MKITFITGSTATKLVDGKPEKKPTRFYGGETEDIVDKEAEAALDAGIALKAGTKEAKTLSAKLLADANPKTRRQNLDAETPGLKDRMMAKVGMKELGKAAARGRLADLGEKMGGSKKKVED